MSRCESHSVRTHDLLEIDARQFLSAHTFVPEWVDEDLRRTPFVVVRRGLATEQNMPVGVRGTERNRRWATFCHPKLVKRIVTPTQLRSRTVSPSRADAVPALRLLPLLERRWIDFDRPWGPGGSVGFELATGDHVAKPESDLDIVIYAERRMTADLAKSLCDSAMDLSAAVDIRVETPICGFSLKEYASQSPAPILLRAPCGVMLGNDPWDELGIIDTSYAAVRRSGLI
jgi:phosphoribosyl-dephospho-CoA transferase